jgi:hypothetical protein
VINNNNSTLKQENTFLAVRHPVEDLGLRSSKGNVCVTWYIDVSRQSFEISLLLFRKLSSAKTSLVSPSHLGYFILTLLQLQGMLRFPLARAFPPRPPFPIHVRFQSSISTSRVLRNSLPFASFGRHYIIAPTRCGHRMLTLGSIFSRSRAEATPTPHVVALITRLEAEANVHPHDISKQMALLEALLDTKLNSSYELVVTRWERMCEFVSFSSHVSLATPHSLNLIRILHRHCYSLTKLSRFIFRVYRILGKPHPFQLQLKDETSY